MIQFFQLPFFLGSIFLLLLHIPFWERQIWKSCWDWWDDHSESSQNRWNSFHAPPKCQKMQSFPIRSSWRTLILSRKHTRFRFRFFRPIILSRSSQSSIIWLCVRCRFWTDSIGSFLTNRSVGTMNRNGWKGTPTISSFTKSSLQISQYWLFPNDKKNRDQRQRITMGGK